MPTRDRVPRPACHCLSRDCACADEPVAEVYRCEHGKREDEPCAACTGEVRAAIHDLADLSGVCPVCLCDASRPSGHCTRQHGRAA
jgi:hypothetical protein